MTSVHLTSAVPSGELLGGSTDRELLELAAKAAGLSIDFNDALPFGDDIKYFDDGSNGDWWNPLTDDGDALRLAVKLSMRVYVYCGEGDDFTQAANERGAAMEPHASDAYAATRRAIVRAAAQIGGGQ